MANDLIAALETAAIPCMAFTASMTENSSALDAQIALIRNHIADLRNGDERAKVAAWHERKAVTCEVNAANMEKAGEDYAAHDFRIMGGAHSSCALAIASGAHMGGNDVDCPPTDAKGDV